MRRIAIVVMLCSAGCSLFVQEATWGEGADGGEADFDSGMRPDAHVASRSDAGARPDAGTPDTGILCAGAVCNDICYSPAQCCEAAQCGAGIWECKNYTCSCSGVVCPGGACRPKSGCCLSSDCGVSNIWACTAGRTCSCSGAEDAFEPNDTQAQAATIPVNVATSLTACSSADWFSVTVPTGKALKVTATFAAAECDLDLYLHTHGQTAAYSSSATPDAPEIAEYDGPTGLVDIEIRMFDTGTPTACRYTLQPDVVNGPVCGDGVVNFSEKCDTAIAPGTAGACITSCTDSGCTHYTLTDAGTCKTRCVGSPITTCINGDSCCPDACTAGTDNNCAADWTACTSDTSCPADHYCDLQRAAPACKKGCRATCWLGDGCCPAACTHLTDSECPADLLPCTADTGCPADHYCDLARAAPACKIGCRTSATCDATHTCAADHRCVLTSVVAHGRCADCSDTDPCAAGLTCPTFLGMPLGPCGIACSYILDTCSTDLGPGSTCDMFSSTCSQGDCP